jgi:hypothetical protein
MKILISSCTKYNAVRQEVILSIKKQFPESLIYIITGLDDISASSDAQIFKSEDDGWSANLFKLIDWCSLNDDEAVLLWIDDLVIKTINPLAWQTYQFIAEIFDSQSLFALKLYETPVSRLVNANDINNGIFTSINQSEDYPISTMVSLIRILFLKKILRANESAWEFETKAHQRIDFRDLTKLKKLNFNLVDISNLVVRGKIVPWRSLSDADNLMGKMNFSQGYLYKMKIIMHFLKLVSIKNIFGFLIR